MKITICCFHDCFENVSAWPTPAGSSFEEASQCKSCFRRRGSQAACQTFLPDLWSQSSPTVRSVFVWEWHTYSPRSLRGEVLRMEYPKKRIVSDIPYWGLTGVMGDELGSVPPSHLLLLPLALHSLCLSSLPLSHWCYPLASYLDTELLNNRGVYTLSIFASLGSAQDIPK